MYRHLLIAAAASLATGAVAHAQQGAPGAAPPPGAASPESAPPPAAAPPSAGGAPTSPGETPPPAPTATGLKAGMPVKDSTGAPVGTISQVGQTSDGRAAAILDVDGQKVGVLATSLTVDPSGAQAVSAMTKTQLLASIAARSQRPG